MKTFPGWFELFRSLIIIPWKYSNSNPYDNSAAWSPRSPAWRWICVWSLYVQVCVNWFPPAWRSDPGPPPVTLWMIAVTGTCLIPAPMLCFWWPPHFDAAARLNPATLCDTHTHTVDQIAKSYLISKQEVLFHSSLFDPEHWYLSCFWQSASTL